MDMGEDFQFWTPYINPVKKNFTISSTEKPKESVSLCIRNSGSNNDVKDVKQISGGEEDGDGCLQGGDDEGGEECLEVPN